MEEISEINKELGVKLQSTLKYFNFDGMDKTKIIEKFDEMLCQREKHIKDLSYEFGQINEKLSNVRHISYIIYKCYDKIRALETENTEISKKLLKNGTLISQLQSDKDVMFLQNETLQNQVDELVKRVKIIFNISVDFRNKLSHPSRKAKTRNTWRIL
jgi:hypothetical protein